MSGEGVRVRDFDSVEGGVAGFMLESDLLFSTSLSGARVEVFRLSRPNTLYVRLKHQMLR